MSEEKIVETSTANLLRREDAAKYLGKSLAWIRLQASRKDGPAYTIVDNRAYYKREDLDAWAHEHPSKRGRKIIKPVERHESRETLHCIPVGDVAKPETLSNVLMRGAGGLYVIAGRVFRIEEVRL